jgi:hypothetical protein
MARGDVFTREDAIELYGRNPLFVFDPDDSSNAPDPDRHRFVETYWQLYPQMLRDLFLRAFTDGLRDPESGRVREGEWRDCMARILDLLTPCPCGGSVFLEPDGQLDSPCWQCRSTDRITLPIPRLVLDPELDRHVVVLNVGRRLFAHHMRTRRYDYRDAAAEVVRHPTAPGVIGLRNLSSQVWTCRVRKPDDIVVPPGRSVSITPDTIILFGHETGVIES